LLAASLVGSPWSDPPESIDLKSQKAVEKDRLLIRCDEDRGIATSER